MADGTDRPRGILAPVDREYLLGSKEYDSRQAEYERKKAIRERVRNGIIDFTILFENMEYGERKGVFGSTPTPRMRFEDSEFETGIRDTFAFMLEGISADVLFDPHVPDETTVKELLREAIERLAWKYGYNFHDMELDIRAERVPEADILEDLEEGRELSPEALAYLLSRDEIETTGIQDDLREMIFENDEE